MRAAGDAPLPDGCRQGRWNLGHAGADGRRADGTLLVAQGGTAMNRQISRRRVRGIALVAAAAPLAAACGAPASPTAAPPATKPAESKPAEPAKPAAEAAKPAAEAAKPTVAAAAPAAGAKATEIIFWPRSPSEAEV